MKRKSLISKTINILFLIFLGAVIFQALFLGITFTTIFGFLILLFLAFFNIIDIIYYRNRNIILKKLRYILIASFVIFCSSFIIVEYILSTELNSNVESNQKIDYIIILGAGLNGDKVSERLEGRLRRGLEYLKERENVKVIVSGGQGKDELISEAEAMGKYLINNGISRDRIIYEDKSTSTIENIYFSKRIVSSISNDKDIKILIVTSDYHMFRAKMICKKLGLESFGITSKSPALEKINYLIREYVATAKDWVYLSLKNYTGGYLYVF